MKVRAAAKVHRAPDPEPTNPLGLCNRLTDLEDRALHLRGSAMRLAADMANLAADTQRLVEDLKKVGL